MNPARRALLVFLSAALAAVLAAVLPTAHTSAAAVAAAQNGVGASHPVMILAVGGPRPVSAGERRREASLQPYLAVGACVAAEEAAEEAAEDDSGLADAVTGCDDSFTAGTKVLLASGAAVPIASLKPGDEILATSTRTGKTQAETVKAVILEHDNDLYDLTVKAADGQTEVIQTTSHHRFWDQTTGRWTFADALSAGDFLRTPGRAKVSVVSGYVPADATGWMWDLTVASDHDFYIDTTVAAVLVHNCPAPSPKFEPPTNPAQPPPDEVPEGWRVRVMRPTEQYPDGYWKLEKPMENGGWQPIDPSDMQPGTRPETHIPLPPGYWG